MNEGAIRPIVHNEAEQKLATDMRSGSRAAFDQLYRRYAPALLGYISKITNDNKSSEEALQKSFIAIWNDRESFDPERERLFTWMLKITKNVTLGFTPMTRYLLNKKTENILNQTVLESITNEKPTGERGRNVLQNHLIDLMHFNNYSLEEAAAILQIEEERIRTSLRNAIHKLKMSPR